MALPFDVGPGSTLLKPRICLVPPLLPDVLWPVKAALVSYNRCKFPIKGMLSLTQHNERYILDVVCCICEGCNSVAFVLVLPAGEVSAVWGE